MYINACAFVAILSDEPEAQRLNDALQTAKKRYSSPMAVVEAAIALARPDKFGISVEEAGNLVVEFMDARKIQFIEQPPARKAVALMLHATTEYGSGRGLLNLGDCVHYACAKHYQTPILATDDEFRATDLERV